MFRRGRIASIIVATMWATGIFIGWSGIGLFFVTPDSAEAHAFLRRSSPTDGARLAEPPSEIRLEFTEPVDPALSSVTLVKDDGREVAGNPEPGDASKRSLVVRIPRLEPGVYTVRWQVISADTHVVDGSFRFSVAVAAPSPSVPQTIDLDAGAVASVPPSSTGRGVGPAASAAGASEGVKESFPVTPEPSAASPSPAERGFSPSAAAPEGASPGGTSPDASSGTPPPTVETSPATAASSPGAFVPSGHSGHSHGGTHDHPNGGTAESGGGGQDGAGGGRTGGVFRTVLRVLDGLVAGLLIGFLFFRRVVAARASALPAWCSPRGERMLAVAATGYFLLSCPIQLVAVGRQLGLSFGLSGWGGSAFWTSGTAFAVAWWCPLAAAVFTALSFAQVRAGFFGKAVDAAKAAAAVALAVRFPLAGHAAAETHAGWAVVFHALHMIAAAVWLGGIVGLLATARAWSDPARREAWRGMLQRFAWAAPAAWAVTAAGGLALAAIRLPAWRLWWMTDYGRLALAKAAILLLVALAGLLHRAVFLPKLRIPSPETPPSAIPISPARWAVRGLWAEFALGLAAFGLAGTLATTPTPVAATAPEAVHWHVMGERVHMTLMIETDARNARRFSLDVWLPSGEGAPESAELRLISPGSPPRSEIVTPALKRAGPDPYGFVGFDKYEYEAEGAYLVDPGEWTVEVTIREKDGQMHRYSRTVSVR